MNQFLRNSPLEHADDPTDAAVDLAPAIACLDHFIADSLEGQWPEGARRGRAVESTDEPQHEANIARLDSRLAILYVIAVGELYVRQDQFVDGQGWTLSGLARSAERACRPACISAMRRW